MMPCISWVQHALHTTQQLCSFSENPEFVQRAPATPSRALSTPRKSSGAPSTPSRARATPSKPRSTPSKALATPRRAAADTAQARNGATLARPPRPPLASKPVAAAASSAPSPAAGSTTPALLAAQPVAASPKPLTLEQVPQSLRRGLDAIRSSARYVARHQKAAKLAAAALAERNAAQARARDAELLRHVLGAARQWLPYAAAKVCCQACTPAAVHNQLAMRWSAICACFVACRWVTVLSI